MANLVQGEYVIVSGSNEIRTVFSRTVRIVNCHRTIEFDDNLLVEGDTDECIAPDCK